MRLQRRAFPRAGLLPLLLFSLAGCRAFPFQPPQIDTGMATIEEAARLTSPCGSAADPRGDVTVHDKRPWGNGLIIIYTVMCPPDETIDGRPLHTIGQTFVEQRKGKWYAYASTGVGLSLHPDPRHFVEMGSGSGSSDPESNYSIIYGKVIAPGVAAVEVTFQNGIKQHDRPKNNIFAIIIPGLVETCDLRVFDAQSQELYRRDLDPFDQDCRG